MSASLTDEPDDMSVVFGRFRDHHRAGRVWHRDDREGHNHPAGSPQRWWSHTSNQWVSWRQIRIAAREDDLVLELLHPDPEPNVYQVCGAVANVMRSLTPDAREWRVARLCYNAALIAAGLSRSARRDAALHRIADEDSDLLNRLAGRSPHRR